MINPKWPSPNQHNKHGKTQQTDTQHAALGQEERGSRLTALLAQAWVPNGWASITQPNLWHAPTPDPASSKMPCLPYPSCVYRHQHWHSVAVLKPNEARRMSTWTKRFIESCSKNTTEQQKFSPHYLLFLSFLMILEKDTGWVISIKHSTAHTNHFHLGAWICTSYSMSTEYCRHKTLYINYKAKRLLTNSRDQFCNLSMSLLNYRTHWFTQNCFSVVRARAHQRQSMSVIRVISGNE